MVQKIRLLCHGRVGSDVYMTQPTAVQTTARILTLAATSECYALKPIFMFLLEFYSTKTCISNIIHLLSCETKTCSCCV